MKKKITSEDLQKYVEKQPDTVLIGALEEVINDYLESVRCMMEDECGIEDLKLNGNRDMLSIEWLADELGAKEVKQAIINYKRNN